MPKTVSEIVVETLAEAGAKRCCGIVGERSRPGLLFDKRPDRFDEVL